MEWVSILFVGLLMGIKHAIEPDHVIAVSTIAAQTRQLWRATLAGVFWGIGHTATLFAIGMALLLVKGEIPEVWQMSLEFLVGIMLVVLGVQSIRAFQRRNVHTHPHVHGATEHQHFHEHAATATHEHSHAAANRWFYLKSTLIGFVHGVAGSGAMFVLTMETVDGPLAAALYLLVFGVGTVIGMLAFTTVLGVPFVLSGRQPQVHAWLTRLTGAVSAIFGMYYMYNLGVSEGLFALWFS